MSYIKTQINGLNILLNNLFVCQCEYTQDLISQFPGHSSQFNVCSVFGIIAHKSRVGRKQQSKMPSRDMQPTWPGPETETWTQYQPGIFEPTILLIQEHGFLITSDKRVSNLDSWWFPVTTSGVVDTVLSRSAFHCTLTQLSGSVHTDRAQPKVDPACLSKLTISPCGTGFQIVSWGIISVPMLPFCIFMLHTTPIWLHLWCQACPMCQASRDRSVVFPVSGWGALIGNGRDVNSPAK